MTFTSFAFLGFLVIVFFLYYLLPWRGAKAALLISSFAFYAYAEWTYLPLLILAIIVSYVAALGIHRTTKHVRRRACLVIAICTNLGVLFAFKYSSFLLEQISFIADLFGSLHSADISIQILLPIGISFYTFQTIGYLVDVYRGSIPACRAFVDYAIYVSFFPQLVAGPIERAGNILPQLKERGKLTQENLEEGIHRILIGVAKKLVLADRFGMYVDTVYNNIASANGPILWLATIAFAWQIYFDFSAYSDIAIGVAQLFGIRLMENFRFPYIAHNIQDFWRRWHISLSSWIRDYLYFPLGGSRVSGARTALNVLVTMLFVGLWHGAAWHFVIWGLYIGVLLVAFRTFRRLLKPAKGTSSIRRLLPTVLTFFSVTIGWTFFRAESLSETGTILFKMLLDWRSIPDTPRSSLGVAILIIAAFAAHFFNGFKLNQSPFLLKLRANPIVKGLVYFLITLVIVFLAVSQGETFIYFQF